MIDGLRERMKVLPHSVCSLPCGVMIDGEIKKTATDGGEGSGNFNHEGRPGMVGGSGSGGHAPHMSASPEYQKQLDSALKEYKGGDSKKKADMLIDREIFPEYLRGKDLDTLSQNKMWREYMKNAGYEVEGLDFNDACDYCMERYTVMEKYTNAHGERKYPLKNSEGTGGYIRTHQQRLKAVQYYTGVDKATAEKMLNGLEHHCGDAFANCEWVDKYIDSNGRYDGPIYRWKGYTGKEAQEKLAKIYPGAKMENPHESNWSFSSDPWATSVFGSLMQDDYTTFCFVCDNNITATPISQYSVYEDEYEVVPHSKTTYTIQSVQMKEHEGHKYWEVKMSEDDWQKDRDIKPFDPPRESEKHNRKYDWWNL